MELLKKHCFPCAKGTPPLTPEEVKKCAGKIAGWRVVDNKKLLKEFRHKDFLESMGFVRKVAEIAEQEGHHPDIHIFYNVVRLEIWTHSIKGLSQNDFILAAKIDRMPKTKKR